MSPSSLDFFSSSPHASSFASPSSYQETLEDIVEDFHQNLPTQAPDTTVSSRRDDDDDDDDCEELEVHSTAVITPRRVLPPSPERRREQAEEQIQAIINNGFVRSVYASMLSCPDRVAGFHNCREYGLHSFRSLGDKKVLLDAASASLNGNAMMTVVLFLKVRVGQHAATVIGVKKGLVSLAPSGHPELGQLPCFDRRAPTGVSHVLEVCKRAPAPVLLL
jgi:hypothetical protein